jgi:hypothetical protein
LQNKLSKHGYGDILGLAPVKFQIWLCQMKKYLRDFVGKDVPNVYFNYRCCGRRGGATISKLSCFSFHMAKRPVLKLDLSRIKNEMVEGCLLTLNSLSKSRKIKVKRNCKYFSTKLTTIKMDILNSLNLRTW